MNLSPVRLAFLLIPFVLTCFALSPQARAVCQEGCLTNQNTVLGEDALFSLTSGSANTAIGASALFSNTTGAYNTAAGGVALFNNTTGTHNTAIGWAALVVNTTGDENTAIGDEALHFNAGSKNTATGYFALYQNGTGSNNTATGNFALAANLSGSYNTASGLNAMAGNGAGSENTAFGTRALAHNSTGNSNIALGAAAGINLTTGDSNIDIGSRGVAGEANTVRIGTPGTHINIYVAGISGVTVPTGVAVIVDANGHLGTTTSSARFKEAIKPMDRASEAILALKPVTFHYKKELDPEGIPQFGLVAEEVEKVNPDLVARDEQGKPYTVRYEAVNAMLLNEFLKARRQIDAQQKQIEALTAGLQKVSAQLEVSKPVLQTIANNQ
jgi:Chaperone of endosialidase